MTHPGERIQIDVKVVPRACSTLSNIFDKPTFYICHLNSTNPNPSPIGNNEFGLQCFGGERGI